MGIFCSGCFSNGTAGSRDWLFGEDESEVALIPVGGFVVGEFGRSEDVCRFCFRVGFWETSVTRFEVVVPDGAFVRGEMVFDIGFVLEEGGVEDPGLSGRREGSVEFVDGGHGVGESVEDASACDEFVGVWGGRKVVDIARPEVDGCAGRTSERPADERESRSGVGGVDGYLELGCDEYREVAGAGTDV